MSADNFIRSLCESGIISLGQCLLSWTNSLGQLAQDFESLNDPEEMSEFPISNKSRKKLTMSKILNKP